MNQKEIIEELKENMPKFNGNQEEVEIKTALYLYIELAKKKTFDERYYWGNQKIRNLAYKESVQDSKSTDKMIKKRKITCVSISHLYKYVLEQFGIQCDVVKEDPEDPHLNNVIKFIQYYEENGIKILMHIKEYFYDNFKEKEEILKFFDYLVLFYSDLLNYKIYKHVTYYDDYIKSIDAICNKNDTKKLINKINVILDKEKLVKSNANTNLLIDGMIIDMEA